jgi:hypothetical protein
MSLSFNSIQMVRSVEAMFLHEGFPVQCTRVQGLGLAYCVVLMFLFCF